MYKKASAFLQAAGRRAAQNSQQLQGFPNGSVNRRKLKTKRQAAVDKEARKEKEKCRERKYWWTVIEFQLKTGQKLIEKYDTRFPEWLKKEVSATSPKFWLTVWDKKTGERIKSNPKEVNTRL